MPPRLSQVLLTDETWIQRCLARVPAGEFGVEWAPGRGALTRGLVDRWTYAVGLELDADFCRELRREFSPENLGVIRTDVRRYPLPERSTRYPLVGNLPYHLTGPLLERILREAHRLSEFQGLLQLEVARRVTAEPGSSDYRSLSLLYRLLGDVELLHRVPSRAFTPPPEVESGWIRFVPDRDPPDAGEYLAVARRCFRYPRKTLLNNLTEGPDQKSAWAERFEEWGWDSRRRPQTLTVEDFRRVVSTWNTMGC